ncbi:MAG: hydroxymethylglutaryl-CoA synthase, partial [Haloarculaceae archaeon]
MSADEEPSIAAVGAYAPRLRIAAGEFADAWGRFEARGVERTAVPEADEDALTMAHEAVRRALDAAGREGGDVTHLAVGTTTPPMAEEDLTPRLASMLGTPE